MYKQLAKFTQNNNETRTFFGLQPERSGDAGQGGAVPASFQTDDSQPERVAEVLGARSKVGGRDNNSKDDSSPLSSPRGAKPIGPPASSSLVMRTTWDCHPYSSQSKSWLAQPAWRCAKGKASCFCLKARSSEWC